MGEIIELTALGNTGNGATVVGITAIQGSYFGNTSSGGVAIISTIFDVVAIASTTVGDTVGFICEIVYNLISGAAGNGVTLPVIGTVSAFTTSGGSPTSFLRLGQGLLNATSGS